MKDLMDENGDLDYETLINSFAMSTLGDMLDLMCPSGEIRKLAECLYAHKMPVNEIFPFLMDYKNLVKEGRERNG